MGQSFKSAIIFQNQKSCHLKFWAFNQKTPWEGCWLLYLASVLNGSQRNFKYPIKNDNAHWSHPDRNVHYWPKSQNWLKWPKFVAKCICCLKLTDWPKINQIVTLKSLRIGDKRQKITFPFNQKWKNFTRPVPVCDVKT